MTESQYERPEIVENEHLEYLDDLRESGKTNMFGAAQYLTGVFRVNRIDAREILGYWMKTFSERQLAKQDKSPKGE